MFCLPLSLELYSTFKQLFNSVLTLDIKDTGYFYTLLLFIGLGLFVRIGLFVRLGLFVGELRPINMSVKLYTRYNYSHVILIEGISLV